MARQLHRLAAVTVKKLLQPGPYPDGGGLYLQITQSGARSWIFKFSLDKRAREMGLGSSSVVSLAQARVDAAECRALLQDRIDPIEARKAKRKSVETTGPRLFKAAALEFIASHKTGWKNVKHIQQWENTLDTYVYPVIGKMDVSDVGVEEIKKILIPIWTSKRETASRVRGRIERILDAEKALG